jgi:hypothetical protein
VQGGLGLGDGGAEVAGAGVPGAIVGGAGGACEGWGTGDARSVGEGLGGASGEGLTPTSARCTWILCGAVCPTCVSATPASPPTAAAAMIVTAQPRLMRPVRLTGTRSD